MYGGAEDDPYLDTQEIEPESPLDHIDEIVFFAEALEALKNASSKSFDAVMKSLSPKEKGMLQELANEANSRKNNPKKD